MVVLPSVAAPGLCRSAALAPESASVAFASVSCGATRISPSVPPAAHYPSGARSALGLSFPTARTPGLAARDAVMFLSSVRPSAFRKQPRPAQDAIVTEILSRNLRGSFATTEAVEGVGAALSCEDDECFGVGHHILGIDIGGTTIKAAPVDTKTGQLLAEKFVVPTPKPSTPESVADSLKQISQHFGWSGAVGVGVPAVARQGVTLTAANIDKAWIGAPVERLFSERMGLRTTVVNDADAAGYAEMGFGSGSGDNERGLVFVVTFGTGIGTAMFVDGILVPNLELGHIELDGVEAEHAAAGVLVERNGWSWDQWAEKVTWYLAYIERLMWPSLFIVGGGVSNAHEEWLHKVHLPNGTRVVPASMKNDAGIVGAAMAALARAAYDVTQKPKFVEEYIQA